MRFAKTYQKLILNKDIYMNFKNKLNPYIFETATFFLILLFSLFSLMFLPANLYADEVNTGESLFKNYCSGCHINGGNIIRRSKNLKISSLKRNGIDTPEAIAKIAKEGIGIMNGYEDLLGQNGDLIVANWVWAQAQKAWIQE